MLHPQHDHFPTTCKASAAMPARRPSSSICIPRAAGSTAFRHWSKHCIGFASGRRCGRAASKCAIPDGLVRLDRAGNEAGQSGACRGRERDRRPGFETSARMVAGGQRIGGARWCMACRRFPSCASAWRSWPRGPTCWSFPPRRTRRWCANGRSTAWTNSCRGICGQEKGTKKEMLGDRHAIIRRAKR